MHRALLATEGHFSPKKESSGRFGIEHEVCGVYTLCGGAESASRAQHRRYTCVWGAKSDHHAQQLFVRRGRKGRARLPIHTSIAKIKNDDTTRITSSRYEYVPRVA